MALLRSSIPELNKGDVALIGIPFDENSSFLRGPAKAPELIIKALESDSANFFTEDLKDLNEHPRIKWCGNTFAEDYLSIERPIQDILNVGAIPFSLGGDHSVAFPIMKAMAKKYGKLNILQFDAHGDLYDELDGNRYSHACPFARIMESGLASSLTQIGVRTMTLHQKEQAEKERDEARRVNKRLRLALSYASTRCEEVHHTKKHQHKLQEPCPVEALIEKAMEGGVSDEY